MMASGYDQQMREELPAHRIAQLAVAASSDRTIQRAREDADYESISGKSFAVLDGNGPTGVMTRA